MDDIIRALERKGYDEYKLIKYLYERSNHKFNLYYWINYLHDRKNNSICDVSDDTIKSILRKDSDHTKARYEAQYRELVVYALAQCCGEEDCDICKGKGEFETRKRIFP